MSNDIFCLTGTSKKRKSSESDGRYSEGDLLSEQLSLAGCTLYKGGQSIELGVYKHSVYIHI